MNRRLEDRIRTLCRRAVSASDTKEFLLAIQELQAALREHAHRLRFLTEARLLGGLPVVERRNTEMLDEFDQGVSDLAA